MDGTGFSGEHWTGKVGMVGDLGDGNGEERKGKDWKGGEGI